MTLNTSPEEVMSRKPFRAKAYVVLFLVFLVTIVCSYLVFHTPQSTKPVSVEATTTIGFDASDSKIKIIEGTRDNTIPLLKLPFTLDVDRYGDTTTGITQTTSSDGNKILFIVEKDIDIASLLKGIGGDTFHLGSAYIYQKDTDSLSSLFSSMDLGEARDYFYPMDNSSSFSPEGNLVAFTVHGCTNCGGGGQEILIYNLDPNLINSPNSEKMKFISGDGTILSSFKFTGSNKYEYLENVCGELANCTTPPTKHSEEF